MKYEKLKAKLLKIKKSVDETINKQGVTHDLLRYENVLKEVYEKLKCNMI